MHALKDIPDNVKSLVKAGMEKIDPPPLSVRFTLLNRTDVQLKEAMDDRDIRVYAVTLMDEIFTLLKINVP